jgi:high-affinity iron transporter
VLGYKLLVLVRFSLSDNPINLVCTGAPPENTAMTAQNLFSVSIFFIVFRETLEAVVIVSVLLGLVEQIVHGDIDHFPTLTEHYRPVSAHNNDNGTTTPGEGESDTTLKRRLVRKLRVQVRYCGSNVESVSDS